MSLFDQQLAALREDFPKAASAALGDGSFAITIPGFPLPPGWSQPEVTLRFIAPVGYPMSKPDCFWCDASLRLAGGGVPQNTGPNQMPGCPEPQLWFSWHVSHWSPNADTLRTYVHVIRKRFQEAR